MLGDSNAPYEPSWTPAALASGIPLLDVSAWAKGSNVTSRLVRALVADIAGGIPAELLCRSTTDLVGLTGNARRDSWRSARLTQGRMLSFDRNHPSGERRAESGSFFSAMLSSGERA
jgi:hypothetical protein